MSNDKIELMASTNRQSSWKLWIDTMSSIPCAAYILKADEELTFVNGNKRAYEIFDITETEMIQKYGNKLGALLTGESANVLGEYKNCNNKNSKTNSTIISIRSKKKIKSFHTDYIYFEHDEEIFIFCASFDITEAINKNSVYVECRKTFEFVARHCLLDCFEYDFETDMAKVYSCNGILELDMLDEQGCCNNFSSFFLEEGYVALDYRETLKNFWENENNGKGKGVIDFKVHSKNNEVKWVKFAYEHKKGSKSTIVGVFEDVTKSYNYIQNYLSETQFYHAILSDKDAYAHLDATEDKITKIGGLWNSYNEIIDTASYTEVVKMFIEKVVHPEDREHYSEFMKRTNFIESLENGIDRLSCEFRRTVDQNKMVWIKIDIHIFKDPMTGHISCLAYLKNIDAYKKQTFLLKRMMSMDKLTNVYTRSILETSIKEYLLITRETETNALLIIDIAKFRLINEEHGNSVGDEILLNLANTLSETFRKTDIIGRYESDKFIVFLKNISSKEWVDERINSFYEILKANKKLSLISCNIGISGAVGFVSYEKMLHEADIALSMAKANENCQCVGYNKEMAEEFIESKRINNNIDTCQKSRVDTILELEVGEGDFSSFVSEHGEIAYLVNIDNFELIQMNEAFYNRMGVSKEECIGKTCYEILHNRKTPCAFCSKVNWCREKFYIWKNINLVLDKEFLIKNKIVDWCGKEVMLALAIDITNNKSIIDYIDGQDNYGNVLGAVQHMDEADNLDAVIQSALESIGVFFRAQSVSFWQKESCIGEYECQHIWEKEKSDTANLEEHCRIDSWVESRKWNNEIIIENPEAMLGHSFEIYKYMLRKSIYNQRWIKIRIKEKDYGYICINNVSINFQNATFLKSLSVFLAGEIRNRKLIEGAVYADNHDSLTKLLSRHSFEKTMLEYDKDEVSSVGVLVGDFNDLKGLNNSAGIQVANGYIKRFAEMLKDVFAEDKIFRLNGDEFLVIALNSTLCKFEEDMKRLNKRLEKNIHISVAIGHSWNNIEKDIVKLVNEATDTMRINKKRYYDLNNKTDGSNRRKILSDLIRDIEDKRFVVFLQSKIDMTTNKVVGAEALIRFKDDELGILPPLKFIDALERQGLIRYVDLFVFESVCALVKKWIEEGKKIPIISVNFSRMTIQETNISDTINDIVKEYGIPKKYIEIEITESASNVGTSVLYRASKEIREAGFSISLDDFGVKYANLAIIADIDFDVLKLDKSLVDKLEDKFKYQAIVKNVIAMCNSMNIRVIAEGVETRAQADKLIELGCNYCQGYLFSKPIEISEFETKYALDLAGE